MTPTDTNIAIRLLRYAANRLQSVVEPTDYKANDTIRRMLKIIKKYENRPQSDRQYRSDDR